MKRSGVVAEASNHSTESSYRKGCRCDRCRRTAADVRSTRRKLKTESGVSALLGNVTPIGFAPSQRGRVEVAVRAALKDRGIDPAKDVDGALAVVLSRQIDNPTSTASLVSAVKQLRALMMGLRRIRVPVGSVAWRRLSARGADGSRTFRRTSVTYLATSNDGHCDAGFRCRCR